MNDIAAKLAKERDEFMERSGLNEKSAHASRLAWDDGAASVLKLAAEWAKAEHARLEGLRAYDCRRTG